jgi:hypothetical protein
MTTMPHTDPDLRDDEPWLDALLSQDAAAQGYIDDAGFTAATMSALPPPAALPRWRKPALTGLWATAGLGLAFVLPGTALDVAREAFRLLAGRSFSLSELAVVLALLGVATWTGTAVALRRD